LEVKSGLKQGDALSPILFDIVIEKIIKDVPKTFEMEMS